MIRIDRGPPPPDLVAAGAGATSAICAACDDGERLVFRREVYGLAKPTLIARQHGKCAFCESKLLHVSSGDVEHFRPKAGWRQAAEEPLQKPGYYWLAYSWDNLLLACSQCNRRHKSNLFPLEDRASRATSPSDDLGLERPSFVDPGAEDPAEHIGFRAEVAVARTVRGRVTVDALGLNRPALVERRADFLQIVESMQAAVVALESNGLDATRHRSWLIRATQDHQQWAAMVRSFVG